VAATLNIAALTRLTGVPPDTIRKWEQRYGVLRPQRTAGGQRRYTELDVARVKWLKARLDEGYRIGEAAALLGTTAPGGAPDDLRRTLVEATVRCDVRTLVLAIDQALALDVPETAFARVLGPALVEIGELWQKGELSVAQEHLATSTVRAALQRLLSDPRGRVRGTAVLACAPGERHEIALLMLAVLLRADGWEVAYLGPDTPVADAVALAGELEASALVFSATRGEAAATLRADLLAAEVPDHLRVVLGGRAIDKRSLTDAVAALR